MKSRTASVIASSFALFLLGTGAVLAQSSPADDIRESNDPARAAEVERKAEAISGRSQGGSGESGRDSTPEREQALPADKAYGAEEREGTDESGASEGGSGDVDEVLPSPESSGGSGTMSPGEGESEGGTSDETENDQTGPADDTEVWY